MLASRPSPPADTQFLDPQLQRVIKDIYRWIGKLIGDTSDASAAAAAAGAAVTTVSVESPESVPVSREVRTVAPLDGGGPLNGDLDLSLEYDDDDFDVDTSGVISLADDVVRDSRAINTDAPLDGGGDLSGDRTLSLLYDEASFAVDTSGRLTFVGETGVPTSRLISTTAPLSGGGDLTEDRTLSLLYDDTLLTVDTSGKLTLAEEPVPTTRLVSTNAPLDGGGALSSNLTLSLNYTANLKVTGSSLDTVQDIQTTSEPQFARLALGAAVSTSRQFHVYDISADSSRDSIVSSQRMTPVANGQTVRGITGNVSLYQNGYTGHHAYGIRTSCYANSASGSATTLTGVYAEVGNNSTGTISITYGIRVATPYFASGGTNTYYYGLTVEPVTGPTYTYGIRSRIAADVNRWNLYVDGTATNYLAGNVLVGTTTDGMTAGGSLAIAKDLAHRGTLVGFYNTAPAAKPTVSGSRGGNAALASLLTALAGLGLLTDSTT